MSELSKLAFRYNQARGQVAMIKGCLKVIGWLPYVSPATRYKLTKLTSELSYLDDSIAIDYQLAKQKLLREQKLKCANHSTPLAIQSINHSDTKSVSRTSRKQSN